MAVRARLNYDTVTGPDNERINYQLDILDEGFTPSVANPVIELVGDGDSPVIINLDKNVNSIYKPVLGSVMDIRLVVPDDNYILPDFNSGTPFQYEVRLRKVLSDNSTEDLWCGYINPLQSTEKVGTTPFGVKFTATDRLGALNQQPLIFANVSHDPSLIGYIGRALRQTGLDLPLYVDSGVRNANGDALLDVAASIFSFFDDDAESLASEGRSLGERATLRESLEGVLETFNCRLYQSKAKWWITNCSTHGDTDDLNTTYAQFVPDTGMTGRDTENRFPELPDGSADPDYIPTANIEEYRRAIATDDGGATVTIPTLRYTIDGTENEDLSLLDEDFTISLRDPFGSVEARPEDLFQDPLHPNSGFDRSGEGWEATGSLDPLEFSESVFQSGGRSITTDRNRQIINSSSEVWFRNSNNIRIDPSSNTNIRFVWRHDGGLRDIRIPFRIRLILPTAVTYDTLNFTNVFSGPTTVSETNNIFYWHFNNNNWEDTSIGRGYALQERASLLSARTVNRTGGISTDLARGGDANEWQTAEVTLDPSDRFINFLDSVDISTGQLEIEFFYPQSYRGANGRRQNQDNEGEIRVWIDTVDITDVFEDENNPVFEYRQPRHTMTETYNPSFISSGPSTFRQFLTSGGTAVGNTAFWEKDQTTANGRTLEELVTGQKLSDNKERLQYFEGTVINRTTSPILPHHKIRVNYSGYSENGVLIQNGARWDTKQNTYDFGGYIPQATALNANDDFTPYNVDLIGARFDGRSSKTRYVLNTVVRGIAVGPVTFGGVAYADGAVVPMSIDAVPLLDERRDPGDEYCIPLFLTQLAGLVTTGAPSVRADSTDEPRPFFASFEEDNLGNLLTQDLSAGFNQATSTTDTTPRSVSGTSAVNLTITHPDDNEYEELHIDVPITEFLPEVAEGIEEIDITINNQIVNSANTGNNVIRVSGTGGSGRRTVTFIIGPSNANNFEVLPSDVTPDFTSGGSNIQVASYRETSLNGATEISFDYDIPAGGETGVVVTLNGTATPVSTATNPTFDYYVNITESISNVSVSGLASLRPILHRDRAGKIEYGEFFLQSNEGYLLSADGFQGATTGSISNVDFIQVASDVVKVLYRVTLPGATPAGGTLGSSTLPATITVTETAAGDGVIAEPFSFTFVANNLGIEGAEVGFSGTPNRGTHRIGYSAGTTNFPSFNLRVSSAEGMAFLGTSTTGTGTFTDTSNEVVIDVNEASVVNTDTGNRVTLDESLVGVTQATAFFNGEDLFFTLDINPSFLPVDPDTGERIGGNYVLDVNVTGAANYSGLYTLIPEAPMILYSGISAGTPSRRTASFNVGTLPDVGRFEITSVTPTGHTATINAGTATVSVSAPASAGSGGLGFTSPDTIVNLRHLDDNSVTATVTVTETLTEPTTPATNATTITALGPRIPATGGSAQFRVVADGDWTVRCRLGTSESTNGSITDSFTNQGVTITNTGTFGPISGGAGETIVTVSAEPLGFGHSSSSFAVIHRLIYSIDIRSEGANVALGNIDQISDLGGRTVTLNSGTSNSVAAGLSANLPTWTFYN